MKNSSPIVLQLVSRIGSGEAEKDVLEFALAVKEAGGTPIVVAASGESGEMKAYGLPLDLKRQGIEYIRLPVKPNGFFARMRIASMLADLIEERHADIIHAYSRETAKCARKAAEETGALFITSFYGPYDDGRFGLKKKYNAVMAAGDFVITPSEYIKNAVSAFYGVSDDKIKILPTGIDETKFDLSKISMNRMMFQAAQWHIPDDAPVIVYPAPFIEGKGQMLMLSALEKMKDMPLRCIFTGADASGKAVEKLFKAAQTLHVEHMVQFVASPVCSETDYAMADVIVYAPERTEAFSHTVLEAQSMTRPVVVTDNGGISQPVQDGVTGFVAKAGNAESLAETIKKALSLNAKARTEMTLRAKESLDGIYNRKKLRENIAAAYLSALKDKSGE